MGLGGILGTVIGGVIGGPAGTAIAGAGGLLDAATNKPKKPAAIPYTDPGSLPNYDIGINYGTGPRVKAPNLPVTIPDKMPNLPDNMPTLPKAQMWAPTAGEAGGLDATNAQSKLYAAMLDPNNPIYKNQVDSQEQLIQNDFLSGLRDSITANRRQQARGRAGFMNPERMDEQITGAVTANAQKARLLARLQALQNLNTIAGGVGNVAEGYNKNSLLETQRRGQYENDLRDRLAQIRADIQTRLGNTRGDISTSIGNSRADIQNALNLFHGATGNAQNATQMNNTNAANYQAANNAYGNVLTNQIGSIFTPTTQQPPSSSFVGPMPQSSPFLDLMNYLGGK